MLYKYRQIGSHTLLQCLHTLAQFYMLDKNVKIETNCVSKNNFGFRKSLEKREIEKNVDRLIYRRRLICACQYAHERSVRRHIRQ